MAEIEEEVNEQPKTDEQKTETLTEQLKTAVEQKEEVLQDFQEVKTEEIEEEEITTPSKFKHFKTIGAVLLICVGGAAIIYGVKKKQNDQNSAFGG